MPLKPLGSIWRGQPRLNLPTKTLNVTYATVRSAAQKLDIYEPATTAPLTIVHVHGGGWTSSNACNQYIGSTKDTAGNKTLTNVLSSFGGALVLDVEYPLIPVCSGNSDTDYRQQQIDAVLAAVTWARANAGSYHGSTTRVITWGESAGGHLVLMAAIQGSAGTTRPDMVMAVSPVTRLDQNANDATLKNYLGIATDNASGAGQVTAQSFSPYNQTLTGIACPFYLLHDVTDPAVPIAHARDMATALTSASATVTKVETSYGIHADFTSKAELLTAYRACHTALVR